MNRRQWKPVRKLADLVVPLWSGRRAVLLSVPYLVLFLWLFGGVAGSDFRLSDLAAGPEASPAWTPPSREHWFGTTATGADLFEMSRAAMANSIASAVVAVAVGMMLAAAAFLFFAFEAEETRFSWPERVVRSLRPFPAMAALAVFAGGAGGGQRLAIAGLAAAVALHLFPVLCGWMREAEKGFDFVAARLLGLPRRQVVLSRSLPAVLSRLPGAFAALLPPVVLAEMGLSFLGFGGERLSVGSIVARGQVYLIEAPWIAVHPGLLATGVVMALALLGWRVSAALGTGPLPRIF